MICPLCGYDNKNNATVCARCGVELTVKKATSDNTSIVLDFNHREPYSNSDIIGRISPELRAMRAECMTYESMRSAALKTGFVEEDNATRSAFGVIFSIPVKILNLIVCFFSNIWGILGVVAKIILRSVLYLFLVCLILLFPDLYLRQEHGYIMDNQDWFVPVCIIVCIIILIRAIYVTFQTSDYLFRLTQGISTKAAVRNMNREEGIPVSRKEAKQQLKEAELVKQRSLARIRNFPVAYWTPGKLQKLTDAFESLSVHSWEEAIRTVK